MEVIKVTLDEVSDIVFDILSEQREGVVYCVADENCAVVGSNGGADFEAIEKAGIKMVQIKHEGGTIILSPGDVDVGIFTEGYSGQEYRKTIVEKVKKMLSEKGIESEINGNDLLIDGRKVLGFGSRFFGKILYTAIHFAVNADLELIKEICTKSMNKVPDSLSRYGIGTNEILEILSETFGKEFY